MLNDIPLKNLAKNIGSKGFSNGAGSINVCEIEEREI
jgi:hypothetical protein